MNSEFVSEFYLVKIIFFILVYFYSWHYASKTANTLKLKGQDVIYNLCLYLYLFLLDNISMETKLQWGLSALSKQGKSEFTYES